MDSSMDLPTKITFLKSWRIGKNDLHWDLPLPISLIFGIAQTSCTLTQAAGVTFRSVTARVLGLAAFIWKIWLVLGCQHLSMNDYCMFPPCAWHSSIRFGQAGMNVGGYHSLLLRHPSCHRQFVCKHGGTLAVRDWTETYVKIPIFV